MQKSYSFLVKSAAWAASSVALLLMIGKFITWWYTGSVSMLASLADSALDLLASITNLIILHYALRPADEEHLFGHGKAESLAALAQAVFITGSAIFLFLNGLDRLLTPQNLVAPELGALMSLVATIITGILIMYQTSVIKKTNSQAIVADALHYKTDFLINLTIMIALLFSWYGWKESDAIFGIVISIYILINAFKLGNIAVQSLLDHQLSIEEQEQFLEIIMKHPEIKGCHDFRTRQSGAIKFLQFHIELDDHLNLFEAHCIADEIETQLDSAFKNLDIIIHIDPLSVSDTEKRLLVQPKLKGL